MRFQLFSIRLADRSLPYHYYLAYRKTVDTHKQYLTPHPLPLTPNPKRTSTTCQVTFLRKTLLHVPAVVLQCLCLNGVLPLSTSRSKLIVRSPRENDDAAYGATADAGRRRYADRLLTVSLSLTDLRSSSSSSSSSSPSLPPPQPPQNPSLTPSLSSSLQSSSSSLQSSLSSSSSLQ